MTSFTLWTFPQLTVAVRWTHGSLHSNASVLDTAEAGNEALCSPPSVLSNWKFTQIQTQSDRHIVNKRPTSGLVRQKNYGKLCVTRFARQRALFADKNKPSQIFKYILCFTSISVFLCFIHLWCSYLYIKSNKIILFSNQQNVIVCFQILKLNLVTRKKKHFEGNKPEDGKELEWKPVQLQH